MKQDLQTLLNEIRDRIAGNDMPAALHLLRALLENTPQLNDVLQQSGRFQYIRQQIRQGLVSQEEATIEQNRQEDRYGCFKG